MERPGKHGVIFLPLLLADEQPARQQPHPDRQPQHAPSARQSSLGRKVKKSNWRGEADSKEAVQSRSWVQSV